jgi:hypothetical protein
MADQGSVTAPATRLPCPTSSGLPTLALTSDKRLYQPYCGLQWVEGSRGPSE